jgi:hypothetical protein
MNYAELIAAAQAYADRQDIEVANNLDTFIIMAEARMNRVLKTRKQSARATTPTVTGQSYYSLPDDFAGIRDIQLNTDPGGSEPSGKSYSYLSPEQMNNREDGPFVNQRYYTIIANQFQIFPQEEAGSQIEIVYYQKVPNLNSTEGEDENWMSLSHPDIYLAGLVAEIELFAKNYDVAKGWHDRMSLAIDELDQSDTVERWSGVALTVRRG